MPLIQVPQAVMPCQVEVPGEVTNRSRPGSIHLKPGVKRLTKEEWDHIAKARPDIARMCRVVPFDETKSKVAVQRAQDAKKAAASQPKRAKDAPTQRQRRLAELEAKKAGKPAPTPAKMPQAAVSEPTPGPSPSPDKSDAVEAKEAQGKKTTK